MIDAFERANNETTRLQFPEADQDLPSPFFLARFNSLSYAENIGTASPFIAAVGLFIAGTTLGTCDPQHLGNCEAGIILQPISRAIACSSGALLLSTARSPLSATEKIAMVSFLISTIGFLIAAGLLGQCSDPAKSAYCNAGSALSPYMEALGFAALGGLIFDRIANR